MPTPTMPAATPGPVRQQVIAATILTALLLWLVLRVHLLGALLAGLLVFELVQILTARLTFVHERRGRLIAVAAIGVVVIGFVTAATVAAVLFFQSQTGGYVLLLRKSVEVIQSWRGLVPAWLLNSLPTDADALQASIVAWLKEHLATVQTFGKEGSMMFARVLIGMVIGALIALRRADPTADPEGFAQALADRATRLHLAFRQVVFAQVSIAALNAALTAFYLLVVLPLLGIRLPLVGTLIVITFLAGLLPVVGNLISNVVVVLVSLSVSHVVAIGSLVYLIVIHKLEYFLNARLVGTRIQAQAWELLMAMLLMEASFGIAGLIAAPIYYAYLKAELAAARWI